MCCSFFYSTCFLLTGDVQISNKSMPRHAFKTDYGRAFVGDASKRLTKIVDHESVDLIMTSPPFGLLREKSYGNSAADEYLDWFRPFGEIFQQILKPTGSLVIDIGGSWNKGIPTRSLYHFELLIMLCKEFGFHLAQEFFWWNPAKLPTPAEWVTVRRVRVKDAVNCVWWLSKTPFPKASNKRVLKPYSDSQKKLMRNGYQPKLRPSGHDISKKFGNAQNSGAIPPNLITIANTESNSSYQRYCRQNDIVVHPARYPEGLPYHFIRMLTDKGDLVVDPFAGSCVTGSVAESMKRKWVCMDLEREYIKGAKGRFIENQSDKNELKKHTEYSVTSPGMIEPDEDLNPLRPDGGRSR